MPWTIADRIDFELLLAKDEQTLKSHPQAPDRLHARDRKFFLDHFASQPPPAKTAAFGKWLEHRRTELFDESPTPGQELQSLLAWFWWVLFLAGLLTARVAVWSFFRGSELSSLHPEPINVLWYAAVCIGLPFLLTLLGFWALFSSATFPRLQPPAFLRGTLRQFLSRYARRIALKAQEHVPHEKRWNANLLAGVVRARTKEHRDVLSAELFHLVQAFGLAFTAGVVLFSWIDYTFYSRVFGWQSTNLSITADLVHRVIQIVAAPWGMFEGGADYIPTLEQVRQTRFIRYQEFTGFPADAASAWARFLIAAALVYGFIPRAIIYTLSLVQASRASRRPNFDFPRYDKLWTRLTTHHVEIGAPPGTLPAPVSHFEPSATRFPEPAPCFLLLPSELNQEPMAERISAILRQQKNFSVADVLVMDDLIPPPELARHIQSINWAGSLPRVVLIQEAFMPPNLETLHWLKQISQGGAPTSELSTPNSLQGRAVSPAHPPPSIFIALIGKPGPILPGHPPHQLDIDVWHEKMQTIGEPNLDVFPISTPA